MAESKKVLNEDILDDNLFIPQIKSAELFSNQIDKIVIGLKELKKESATSLKANKDPKNSKEIKQATKDLNDFKKAEEAIIKLEEKKNKVKQEALKLTDEQIKDAYIQKQIAKDRKAELEALAIIESKLIGTEQKLLAQNTLLRLERKRLNEADKDYQSRLKEINATIDANNKKISENSDKLKQNSMNVGNYTDSVREAIDSSELMGKAFGSLNESNSILVNGFQVLSGKLGTIKEALSNADTTGKKLGLTLKGLGIGLLISAIASLGAMFTSSREGGQKFALVINNITAILNVLVGRLALAGTALTNIFKNFAKVMSPATLAVTFYNEGWEGVIKSFTNIGTGIGDISNIFKDFTKDVEAQKKMLDELTVATFEYENALRKLQLTQLKLNLDEEDANEIYADETRILSERNKALNDAIKLRKASAQIGVQIAKTEEDLAMKNAIASLQAKNVSDEELEMIKKKGAEYLVQSKFANKLTKDELDNLNEKVKANLQAEDALADLPRQEATRLAKQVQDQQSASIELILKKKLNAQEEIAILTKQVADEKIILSERAKIIENLRTKELESTQALIDKFNQKIDEENKLNKGNERALKQRVDFQDLINTKDSVALGEKLKALKITEAQQELVAKIVADAQNNEIANNDRIIKQKNDLIALKEREQRIDFEILQIQKATELDVLKDLENAKLKELEDYNTQVLQQENVFNNELLNLRKQAYNDAQLLREEEFKQRQDDFERKAEQAKKEAEKNIVEPTELAKKKIEIETQLNRDLKQLEIEKQNATIEANKKELEQLRQIEIKKTEIVINDLQKITDGLSEQLDKRTEKQERSYDREITRNQRQIERQADLSQRGLANQLAFEESQLAKNELAKRQLQEREQKRQELIEYGKLYLSSYNARLSQPNADPNTASFLALKDVFLAKGLAKTVQFFNEGTDYVTPKGQPSQGKGHDYIPAMLAEGEAVIPQTANDKNRSAVKSLIDGTFDQVFRPISDNGNVVYRETISSKLLQEQSKTNKLLSDLIAKPVQQVNVNEFRNLVETLHFDNRKEVYTYKGSKRRL
jgi:hypothetical protein